MNIVLIVIDTLRADHLSCYGYFRNTSPAIDRIAKDGVLFENFYASGIPTGPGFTSIITGLYPIEHKYYITPWDVPNTYQLDDNIPVLAEILWDNGYVTAAVDNLINFKSHMKHFVRGFEYYMNPTKTSRCVHHHVIADQVNSKAIPWIRRHNYEKFFLFVHYWDPHTPYNQPEGYRKVFDKKKGLRRLKALAGYEYVPGWGEVNEIIEGTNERSIDLYDGEVLYVDNSIAEIVETLEEKDILDDTFLIITSDHGEQLGQHGIWGHAGLHESIVKVPLIMRYPQKLPTGLRIKGYSQHSDIVPTVLDFARIKHNYKFDGTSLLRMIKGSRIRNYSVCEAWGERCIISGGWKLIVHYKPELSVLEDVFPKPFKQYYFKPIKTLLENIYLKGEYGYELYNIKRDPVETINLAEERTGIVKELEKTLKDWVNSRASKDPMLSLENYTQPQPVRYQRL